MLTVEVDVRSAQRWLQVLHRDQIPFALMKAINKTALGVQGAVREDLDDAFALRRQDWARRNVKIGRDDFAKKNRLRAIVRLEAPGDPSRSDILAKFEERTTKKPRDGSRLAVPVDVRTTRVGITRTNQRPRSFDFVHHGRDLWIGKNRTFMIRKADGTGGIYQRIGRRGRRRKDGSRGAGAGPRLASDVATQRTRDLNVKILFRFTPLARNEKRLHFEDTAKQVILTSWDRNFMEAFQHAIRTAR